MAKHVRTARRYCIRTVRNRTVITTLALGSSGATTLLFNLVAARTLSHVAYGRVATTLAAALLVAQITMAGPAPGFARQIAVGGSQARRLRLFKGALTRQLVFPFVLSALFPILKLVGLVPAVPGRTLAA